MKKDFQELKKKSREELTEQLQAQRGELQELQVQVALGKTKDVRAVHKLRKDVARTLTALSLLNHEQ